MQIDNDFNIKSILFSKRNPFSKLCYTSQKLKAIDDIFQKMLRSAAPNLVAYCQIGNVQNNCLTIETSRSEYLTTLKFNSQQLLHELRQSPELSQIITIKYKVRPELVQLKSQNLAATVKKNTTEIKHSPATKQSLQSTANKIDNPELKLALLRLANLT